jgi:hypothetical protein
MIVHALIALTIWIVMAPVISLAIAAMFGSVKHNK